MDMTTALAESPLGTYPPDWPVAKLASLRPFITSGSRGWARYYADHGASFIRITNLSRESIYPDLADLKLVNLPPEDHEGARTQLHRGDLLVSITADIGIIGYVDDHVPNPSYINQHIALVRCDAARTDTKYLAYFLASERPQRVFRSTTDQGAKAGMSLSGVGRIEAAFPAFAEQRAIATALGHADALLDALDKLIAKKRDLKQAAMQQLLTGRTRLPGFTGEWQRVVIGDIAAFLKGQGLLKDELAVDGTERCIHYGELFTHYQEAIRETISRTNQTGATVRSVANDVVMPTSDVTPRGLAKASCILLDHVILGGDILVIRTDRLRVNGTFLSYVIRHDADQVLQLVTGSTVYHLYGSDMRNFAFALPQLDEQGAIIEVLSDMAAEIAVLESRRAKTRDLKQAMMQELLTGRTRLVHAEHT